jgi:hypothetical protein
MAKKPIALFLRSGPAIYEHRRLIGMNQTQYWGRIAITQSAASRYEAGRNIPRTVLILLHLAYADKALATALFKQLRGDSGDGNSLPNKI